MLEKKNLFLTKLFRLIYKCLNDNCAIFSCNSLADVSNSSLLSIFVAYAHTSQGTPETWATINAGSETLLRRYHHKPYKVLV